MAIPDTHSSLEAEVNAYLAEPLESSLTSLLFWEVRNSDPMQEIESHHFF